MPSALLATTAVTLERRLVLLGGWEPWVQALVLALSVVVLVLSAHNYRHLLPRWRRSVLLGLRSLAVATLLGVFYQPACLEEHVVRARHVVPVLVDTSQSMALAHGDATRLDLVRRFLTEHAGDLWPAAAEVGDLHLLPFDADLHEEHDGGPAAAAAPGALAPTGRETRLAQVLAQLRDRYRNQDLGGVIVLSDGIDTTPAGRRGALDPATEEVVRALDAPLYLFHLPDDGHLQNLAVTDIASHPFAFLLNATSLDATVRVDGYPAGRVTVRLTEDGAELATETLDVRPGQRAYPVSFQYVPRQLGKHVYAVTIEPQPGEVTREDNRREALVNVLRDEVRVLQIVGQPSWDERFLREHLKRDPNVDLISFFILVSGRNVRPLSASETALIPFPVRELFEEELGGFDLVLFQNFNYGPFGTREHLPAIAQFVRDGGALAMVGGPLSLTAGGYYGTPIVDVLPVDIPPQFGDEPVTDEAPFLARLTDAGRHHPVTRLALDPQANAARWAHMTELEGTNLVTRAKPDAVVLLEHPALRDAAGDAHPIVAVRQVGQGRSLVVTTDSTWQWAFQAGQEGGDALLYDAFWSAAIRWLIKDPALDLVRVRAHEERALVGEPARITVEVFRPDYRPAARHPLDVVVRRRTTVGNGGPLGPSGASAATGGEEVLRLESAQTDTEGELEVAVPLPVAGIYEVEARASVVEGRVERGVDLFVVTDTSRELEDVVGDGRLVEALARASGGATYPLDVSPMPHLALRQSRVVKVASRQQRDLWNAPPVLVLLTLLLGAEWWLRRRFGYL